MPSGPFAESLKVASWFTFVSLSRPTNRPNVNATLKQLTRLKRRVEKYTKKGEEREKTRKNPTPSTDAEKVNK